MDKTGRNAPCPCGSGLRYKHCCLKRQDAAGGVHPPDAAGKFFPVIRDILGQGLLLSLVLIALAGSAMGLRADFPMFRTQVPLHYEDPYRPLKAALSKQKVAGYISGPSARLDSLETDRIGLFYLTQYALAPVMIHEGTGHPVVIGQYRSPSDRGDPASLGLTVVEDYGNGLVLYRKTAGEKA